MLSRMYRMHFETERITALLDFAEIVTIAIKAECGRVQVLIQYGRSQPLAIEVADNDENLCVIHDLLEAYKAYKLSEGESREDA